MLRRRRTGFSECQENFKASDVNLSLLCHTAAPVFLGANPLYTYISDGSVLSVRDASIAYRLLHEQIASGIFLAERKTTTTLQGKMEKKLIVSYHFRQSYHRYCGAVGISQHLADIRLIFSLLFSNIESISGELGASRRSLARTDVICIDCKLHPFGRRMF